MITKRRLAAFAAVVAVSGGGAVILDPPVFIGTEASPPVTVLRGAGSGGVTSGYPTMLTETSTANVWLSPIGSDTGSGCNYASTPVTAPSSSTVCGSFDHADALAQGGGSNKLIGVIPGTYPATTSNYGYSTNILSHGSNPVTFECQTGAAADSVTFSDAAFLFFGAENLTFTGSCFHFHVPSIGLRGYSPGPACNSTSGIASTGPITFNGVHMDSFDIAGTCDITIENSQVGPIIQCFAPGQNGGFAECPTTGALSSVTAYWATVNTSGGCSSGTTSVQAEPFIHSNGPNAFGTTLNNDLFYGMNSMATSGSGGCGAAHQGGLLLWSDDDTTVENTTFLNNTIYDVEYNASSAETNAIWQNNVFGPPVNSNETQPSTLTPTDLANGSCQEGIGNISGQTFTNDLFRYNTFSVCENVGNTGSSFTNVRFVGNLIGAIANCTAVTGITYTSNVTGNGGGSCGGGGGTLAGSPFTSFSTNVFTLGSTASPPAQYVANCTTGGNDANLTTDIGGLTRPKTGSTCDAGANENQ